MTIKVNHLGEDALKKSELIASILKGVDQVVEGQENLIERLILAMLCKQHVLIEGELGLAKIRAVAALAEAMQLSFRHIQFTPELTSGDLLGKMIYNPITGNFSTQKGLLFSNIILADDINLASAKVQDALLEAIQENQITIGHESFPLMQPFMVVASQNSVKRKEIITFRKLR